MSTLQEQTKVVSAPVKNHEPMYNDAPRTFTDAELEIGSGAHQGDVIFIRIDNVPKGAKPRANRQLAIGTTQGSRHILQGGELYDVDAEPFVAAVKAAVKKYRPNLAIEISPSCVGPVFKTNGLAEVDHPEHGNHIYKGDMTIACVYQRNLDAEEREMRMRD